MVYGNFGAILATLGIFLPSFLFVILINPWGSKIHKSPLTSGFLDGVNTASLGLMAGVTYTLIRTSIIDIFSLILSIVSLILVFCYQINSAYLVLGSAILGFIFFWRTFKKKLLILKMLCLFG